MVIDDPGKIEASSFETIRSEIGKHPFDQDQLAVAVRVIHATADFEFKELLRFHPSAIDSGIAALRNAAPILADVHMVEAGISQAYLDRVGSVKVCDIRHPAVIKAASNAGQTRAVMAMRRNKDLLDGGIVAIGNAPTALFEVIRLVQEESVEPALIVGVPVGFVNTVESKDALTKLPVPHITCLGRKGGSPVAVAIINALLRMAVEDR
jgi:precorrin-8X/cobalt-precorrin-8 methylmutase